MRKMKCFDCGRTFDEEEAETRQENVGDFWGSPAYMTINICPFCRSDEIDEADVNEEEE